jgi:hypothetical protein
MLALLTPRFWIGLALAGLLAFTHAFVYRAGRAAVRAQWDADVTMRMNDALVAEKAARAKEQDLIAKNQKVSAAYAAEKKRRVADAAVAAGRLRDLEAALAEPAGTNPAAEPGNYGDPRSAIIAQCAGTVAILDEAAQRLAGQTTALQRYIGEVCLKP